MRTLPLLPALLLACGDKDPGDSGDSGGLNCTTQAVVSVEVTVEDADGAFADPDALTVRYHAGDGAWQGCEEWPTGPTFACGFEVAGDVTVRAEAPGYAHDEQTVTVGSDACHVLTEQVTLTLLAEELE